MVKAVCLLKDANLANDADESVHEPLSQRVFDSLAPNEQELNFLRDECSTVSL